MIAFSHPTGNANVRAVVAALEASGKDYRFFTTLGFGQNDPWVSRFPGGLRKRLGQRTYPIPANRMERRPLLELVRLAARGPFRYLARHNTGPVCVDAVYRDLDAHVARTLRQRPSLAPLQGVYCYEDAALETFGAAKSFGAPCWYDLPIAYWETSRRLLAEEAERYPEWAATMVGTEDSEAKFSRKTREAELADVILCPSRFVRDSLPLKLRETRPCVVAEFGSPQVSLAEVRPPRRPNAPLRVLFAGGLSQRKGLADLFRAIQMIGRSDVELVVMGSPIVPLEFYRRQLLEFVYEPPRSHSQVLALMQTCDVFALPSIVEGRALVQQEALSCGLPLIVTPNAGGDDLIVEGETGFLVPVRNPAALAEKISWFADHRDELPEMRRAAMAKAAEYSWTHYAEKVFRALSLTPEPSLCV